MRWLVRLYPAGWRRRYGAEMETVLASQEPSLWQVVDVLRGALDARLHPETWDASRRPFSRLAESGHRVLTLAQEEAQRLGHGYLGTEHVLLGLARAEAGPAARVLRDLGMSPDAVRSRISAILGPATPGGSGGRCQLERVGGGMRLTCRTKRVFERAAEEADRRHDERIGDAHLLLGIVAEREGVGAAVLHELGARDADAFRRRVLEALAQHPS